MSYLRRMQIRTPVSFKLATMLAVPERCSLAELSDGYHARRDIEELCKIPKRRSTWTGSTAGRRDTGSVACGWPGETAGKLHEWLRDQGRICSRSVAACLLIAESDLQAARFVLFENDPDLAGPRQKTGAAVQLENMSRNRVSISLWSASVAKGTEKNRAKATCAALIRRDGQNKPKMPDRPRRMT